LHRLISQKIKKISKFSEEVSRDFVFFFVGFSSFISGYHNHPCITGWRIALTGKRKRLLCQEDGNSDNQAGEIIISSIPDLLKRKGLTCREYDIDDSQAGNTIRSSIPDLSVKIKGLPSQEDDNGDIQAGKIIRSSIPDLPEVPIC
jgi:hypothetical protein